MSLSLNSCHKDTSHNQTTAQIGSYENSESNEVDEVDGYEDGIYCASVEYYYTNTGTHSVYILEVEVEENEIVKIYWPNGGWLDTDHFLSIDILDGMTSFTSDHDVDYTVKLIGKQGECRLSLDAWDEDDILEYEAKLKRQEEQQLLDEDDFYKSLEEEEDSSNPLKEDIF